MGSPTNVIHRAGLFLALLSVAQAITCRPSSRQHPASDVAPAPRLSVEWGGCAGVREGPICEIGKDGTLTLWVPGAAPPQWQLRADRELVEIRSKRVIDGGTQVSLVLRPGTRRLCILDERGDVLWELRLGDATSHEQIDRSIDLGHRGEYAAALRALDDLRGHARPEERGPADAAIGRMSLALGDVRRAEPALRAAIQAAIAEGRLGDAVRDSSALVWALVMLEQRFGDARTVLDTLRRCGSQFSEGIIWIDYHQALLAEQTGDIRTALLNYRAAERGAHRLDRSGLGRDSSMGVALQLARVGRVGEAIESIRDVPVPADACAKATWSLNLAWMALQGIRHETRGKSGIDAWQALLEAERATAACPDPHRHLLALVNSAEFALESGDDVQVERLVSALQALPPNPDVLFGAWRLDVLGRWYLRRGLATRALAAFEDQLRRARGAGLFDEEFRAEVGSGLALLALRDRPASIVHLKSAQALLMRMMRQIPLGEGRGSFLDGHDEGVRTLVGALVAGGATREALAVARQARSAELLQAARIDRLARFSVEARRKWDDAVGRYQHIRREVEAEAEKDWTLPKEQLAQRRSARQQRAEQGHAVLDDAYRVLVDEQRDLVLAEPNPTEVYLAFFPGVREWYAFAAGPTRVTVESIAEEDFASLENAGKILARFRPLLNSANHIRLLPYGISDSVDWHAIPWNDRPLSASFNVEYGLDIPTRVGSDVSPSGRERFAASEALPRVLVMADPTGDLPASRFEAASISSALAGWPITILRGGQATGASLLSALPGVDLFHYAGHAVISGREGAGAALVLAGESRIEVGDVLAAPSVPSFVFLSACEAAGTSRVQPSLMGLGQSFVAAGSLAVIAPNRPILDRDAQEFVSAFYPAFVKAMKDKRGERSAAGEAYRAAVLALTAGGPAPSKPLPVSGSGWESFRLFGP